MFETTATYTLPETKAEIDMPTIPAKISVFNKMMAEIQLLEREVSRYRELYFEELKKHETSA